MQKNRINNEVLFNTIENVNATDKGKLLQDNSIDIIFCDPPIYKNSNDKSINNWSSESDYYKWFRIFITITAAKLKRTGIFYLIGDIEDIHPLIGIIHDFDFQISATYYFTKNRRSNIKKSKENPRTHNIVETVFVFTRNFQRDIKKLLMLKKEQYKIKSKDINMELGGNGNGGGYWSVYCGDNQKNIIPTEEHWNKFRKLFDIDLDYNEINTQFKPYEGNNLWDDIIFEEDRFLPTFNRPISLFERLILLNKRNSEDVVVWDPFCGYGNSTMACKKMNCNYIAFEFDVKIFYKATINTGISTTLQKPISVESI